MVNPTDQTGIAKFERMRRLAVIAGIAGGLTASALILTSVKKIPHAEARFQAGLGLSMTSLLLLIAWGSTSEQKTIEEFERDQTALMGAAFDEVGVRRAMKKDSAPHC